MGSEDKEFKDYFRRAHHLAEELLSTYDKNLSLDGESSFRRIA